MEDGGARVGIKTVERSMYAKSAAGTLPVALEDSKRRPASFNEVVASAFGCIVADELNKVKQTSLNGQGPHVDGPNDEASGEGDMLWQYDTMALPLPAELADEDYEELMLVMEHALYDDLQAELQIQESLNKTLHKVEL
ncbi:unnamed protein product [Sphagnum jensenii]|uniref:RPA-interacting protein central domain-containing protein n=1 Tax=Sphagnum jensenii TaxID=128206 RepID=A0ABP0WH13_9BRYO